MLFFFPFHCTLTGSLDASPVSTWTNWNFTVITHHRITRNWMETSRRRWALLPLTRTCSQSVIPHGNANAAWAAEAFTQSWPTPEESLLWLQGTSKCVTSGVGTSGRQRGMFGVIYTTSRTIHSTQLDLKRITDVYIYTGGGGKGRGDRVLRFTSAIVWVKEQRCRSSSREAHRGWGRRMEGKGWGGGVD